MIAPNKPAPGPGYIWDYDRKMWVPTADTVNDPKFQEDNFTVDGQPKYLRTSDGGMVPTASYVNQTMGSGKPGALAKAKSTL